MLFHTTIYDSSDWNTRLLEPNAKKQSSDYATNAARGDGYSNTRSANQGIYQLTPDGRFALTWTADDSGFQPKGDHLPTPPPMPEDRSVQTSTGIKRLLESNAQKHLPGYGIHPAHGYSHSNTRSTNHDGIYWISPEGRRFTLTWVPDDRPSVQASSGEEWDLPIPDVHPPATDALPNWELDHYYDH